MKILAISEIRGRENLAPYIAYLAGKEKVDAILFVGNIVSPIIIDEVSRKIDKRILGVAGNLDDPSITRMLKLINGFIEGKIVEINGLRIGGIGVNLGSSFSRLLRENKRLDILVSFYPGRMAGVDIGLSIIDSLIENLKPKLVIFGKGRKNCLAKNNYVFLGEGYSGFYSLINIKKENYSIQIYCNHFQDVVLDNH